MVVGPLTWGLSHWARQTPDRPAVVDDRSRLTFAQLDRRVDAVARWLRDNGADRSSPALLALRTGAPAVEAFLACGRAGVTCAPIPSGSTAAELAYYVDDAGAAAVISEQGAEVPSGVAHVAVGAGYEAMATADVRRLTGPEGAEWPLVRPYTSGTTGRPKAVLYASTDDDFAQQVAFLGSFGIADADEVNLTTTPFHHISAWAFAPPAVLLGQTVVLLPRFEPAACLSAIERHRVTWLYLVPTQMGRIARLPVETRAAFDLSSVKVLHHGASVCPVAVKLAMFELFGPVIWEQYGGTEGGIATCSPEEWLARPGTVGKAHPGSEIAVLDEDGTPLPPGEVGQIYARAGAGGFSFDGAPDATAEAWRDGWFTLGDVGRLDDDGYLFLVDRKKDMVVTGGANVYPAEVEQVLYGHPAVLDCIAVGVPDDDLGEAVHAVVVSADPIVSTGELIEHCRQRLVAYKCPRTIELADSLPRSALGKLLRREVRERYWAAAGS